ncbi:SpoIIE family protein phosphatase [Microbulbifer rhizosphaerae]|uniref:Serine phosphatase RsbU (Regulator of sigma subunit)/anti-sigma regulatory factor (Ser/Thr protein kinase) n=1 Tax=Microbulbifer rhizosphaerae TaxID=1562603 RepID=A0A7W4WAR7_9GAMM|nr:serine phosphatase RsbU (regulator of sigma subunit)/anti-sigma regulatory factor (Ser/Thr protein kinase) [Microbulbifer rhizosphaerae]
MPGPYRVLVIEADIREAGRLLRLLRTCAGGEPGAGALELAVRPDTATALADYLQLRPDLVIYGPAAARDAAAEDLQQLRGRAGTDPVPILFVRSDRETLSSACLKTGCDDILFTPYNPILVQLKLAALRRFSHFNRALQAQRIRIRRSHADLLQEQASARQIFDKLGHESCLDQASAIRYHLSPRAVLNGDVLAAAYAPGGKLMLLLGDFTGHGLAAAVGAVPLTASFYSMVPKGFSLGHILREINAKLHRILPSNMFCCAVVFELDPHKRHIRLFNGGMPRACLRRRSGDLRLLESRHLPLGVLEEAWVEEAIVHIPVEAGDHLYLWSDGIHEAHNQRGELFGEERLLQAVIEPLAEGRRFDHLLNTVNAYSADQHDDLSLVEVALDEVSPVTNAAEVAVDTAAQRGGIGDWSLNFTLGPEELRDADPLPLLHSVLAQVPGACSFHDHLTIVLGELFRNALEHGLLRLDSGLKQTDRGFTEYYRQLEEGRRRLREGWIRIQLRCRDRGASGELEVVVEDSGIGLRGASGSDNAYSGRGLPLLKAICREVEIQPGSSRVRATLNWGEAVSTESLHP